MTVGTIGNNSKILLEGTPMRTRQRRCRNLAIGLLFQFPFIAVFAHAQPSWSIVGGAFTASPEEIRSAASKIPSEEFMETTVLFERDGYTFDAAGRLTYSHRILYRIENQAGIEDWAEIRAHWEPWYQNQPQFHARVIEPDGKVIELDQKTVTDGPAKEDDEDTYTDARVRKAPLPGMTVGAIVEDESITSDKLPYFSGGEAYRDSFLRSVPNIHSELVIDAPTTLKLRYRVHLMPNVKISEDESAGIHHLRFVQGYLGAVEDSDIDLPTHNFSGPLIEFSTGESWSAVASAYRELVEPQIDPNKVKSLLPRGDWADRAATIQGIVAQLHKDVRYTGVEFGESSLQPASAAEVIKRHYGDCKDKAALLVGMLRAAGIPASIALLDSGPGLDVTPELPGMNQFDHAIVYVPSRSGGDPLWIDATAEYSQVGTLPSMDEGRLALIIAEGTTSLTLTRIPKAEDDSLTELRDVVMADYGSAHIVETSVTHGEIDATYRSDFGGTKTREEKANLEKYAKDEYLAKALASVQHGNEQDLTKPFDLKLDVVEAKRANTLINDAAVALPFSEILVRLPEWFRTDPKVDGEKLTPQQEDNRKRAVQARTDEYDVHPFTTEWRYTITPPAGFVLRALPENKVTEMGPARLTQHYETDSQGMIKAVLRFETDKPRYTVDDALALRTAVLAAYKQDMILIEFDQIGSKLLAAGKIREGLAADRDLIAKYPAKAVYHSQTAYALLHAGLGEKARQEALLATKLDSKSAVGFVALGWICQFNAIGVQRSSGFDWDCAGAAYKRALEIDPDDSNTAINLAVLEEFDNEGERYSAGSRLTDAISGFRALKVKDKEVGDQYEDSLLFDLFYSRRYKELLDELAKLPSSLARQGLTVSAAVAQLGGDKGIAAGIDRADHLAAGPDERSAALGAAGNLLLRSRLYPEATGILSAATAGQADSSATAQQVAIFRSLTPWKGEFLPATDPRSVVQRMYLTAMTGTFTEKTANEVLSRHAYGSDHEWQTNLKHFTDNPGMLHSLSAKVDMPASVLLDAIVGNLKLTAAGDDEIGHRISVQSLGAKAEQLFITKEDGAYKIVTDGKDPSEAGNEVLFLLHEGKQREAQSLLDWMRDRMHKGGGDDPLSGPLLPRFWTVGDAADPAAMHLAGASLVATNSSIKDLLPSLRAQLDKTTSEDARLNLELLLANGYATAENAQELGAISSEILKKYPDSYVAIGLVADGYAMQKDWDHWSEMLTSRLSKHPDDEFLLRLKVRFAEAKGDFALARETEQILMNNGKAAASDYNNFAWLGLFDGKVDADSTKSAQQATMLTSSSTFSELHTLACIYAYLGKVKEARDALLKAMAAGSLSQPNSAVWYGFGSIYEQYGVTDAAIDAYKKVERPDGKIDPTSTYLLAQSRLKALGAAN